MYEIRSQLSGSLNSAEKGQELAEAVARELEASSESVTLDFSDVYRMTPSFANAFVMLLAERVSLETMQQRLRIENRQPHVAEAMNRSARRYQQGLRLTIQC